MSNRSIFLLSFAAICALTACNEIQGAPTGEQKDRAQTQQLQAEAANEVGLPNITNFTEKKLAVKLAELRDQPNLATFTYIQGLDGRLICLGRSIGYGLPYSTQITNPMTVERHEGEYGGGNVAIPQPDPNTLYSPADAEATWVMLVGSGGQARATYVEPKITVTLDNLRGPAVSAPCA